MKSELKKVWIVGASGHTGSAILKLLNQRHYEIFVTDQSEVDVTDRSSVHSYMQLTRPAVVINCAGLTDLEECEADPDRAYLVNAIGARNLAMEADAWDCKLIQLSTDDVFEGAEHKLYTEFDRMVPRSVYGKSKYAGEVLVESLSSRFVVIRSSWVYGTGKDFVNTVLNAVKHENSLKVPVNQFASPTSAEDLAKVICEFIDNDLYGIYHAVGSGYCSRFEFAQEILKNTGNEDKLELIPVDEKDGYPTTYSVLDNMMLRLDDVYQPGEWKQVLEAYLKETGGDE